MATTLNKKTKSALSVAAIALFLVLVYVGDIAIPAGSSWKMLITVIEKGSIYALVAASMNLLNGFTGLFSLGQAGFMLIGAYTYAIFTIPAASHDAVYQYFEGGVIKWSIVEALEGSLGVFGHYLGMLIPMLGAGSRTNSRGHRLPHRYTGAEAQVRLPRDSDTRIRGDTESFLPVEHPRPCHQRIQCAA